MREHRYMYNFRYLIVPHVEFSTCRRVKSEVKRLLIFSDFRGHFLTARLTHPTNRCQR